jgi:hypothetical protein
VVVIAGPNGPRQFTFHHPIGQTNLTGDEWVLSETSDVPDLLQRAEHPQKKTVEENRAEFRRLFAAEAVDGITVNLQEKTAMVGTMSFFTILADARARAKDNAEGGKPAPDAYKRELESDRLRALNETYLTHLMSEAVRMRAEERVPLPAYITRSGPRADRDQEARATLKGKSRAQAMDAVMNRLYSL